MNSFQGRLPSEPEVLVKQIEGIGPYTAGAIASIAYGVKAATVDGNVSAYDISFELRSLVFLLPDSARNLPNVSDICRHEEESNFGLYLGGS